MDSKDKRILHRDLVMAIACCEGVVITNERVAVTCFNEYSVLVLLKLIDVSSLDFWGYVSLVEL